MRRHPHVFGEVDVDSAADVKRNWDQIKDEERGSEPGVANGRGPERAARHPACLEGPEPGGQGGIRLVRGIRGPAQGQRGDRRARGGPRRSDARPSRSWAMSCSRSSTWPVISASTASSPCAGRSIDSRRDFGPWRTWARWQGCHWRSSTQRWEQAKKSATSCVVGCTSRRTHNSQPTTRNPSMTQPKIERILARQILDSRGQPYGRGRGGAGRGRRLGRASLWSRRGRPPGHWRPTSSVTAAQFTGGQGGALGAVGHVNEAIAPALSSGATPAARRRSTR